MATKLKNLVDGFNVYMMGGDLNGHCKSCGAISTMEYRTVMALARTAHHDVTSFTDRTRSFVFH